MEDLQLVLSVLGGMAIAAVLVHGFWSIRRQQPKSLKDSPKSKFHNRQLDRDAAAPKRIDADGFDADGIGAVRVRKNDNPIVNDAPAINPYLKQGTKVESQPAQPQVVQAQAVEAVKAPAPEAPPPEFTLEAPVVSERAPKATQTVAAQTADTPKYQSPVTAPKVQGARPQTLPPTQTALFDDEDDFQSAQNQDSEYAEEAADDGLGEPRDVLVLHVVAKEGQQLNGAELLPCFLTLNFKFGEMNIFHRHVDNAGNGKVLFSIANMVKPGTFNPDDMEQFTTQGVVFFMTLPCYGDALMNFSIMLNSARSLADDMGAVVLDGQRQPWGEFTKQDYLHRIRAHA